GNMSAISTALPRMRAPTATWIGVLTGIPVPFSISTRTTATRPRVMKKKIVGGITARNSSLTFSDSLLIGLFQDWRFGATTWVDHFAEKEKALIAQGLITILVETRRIELPTSALRTRRSPS